MNMLPLLRWKSASVRVIYFISGMPWFAAQPFQFQRSRDDQRCFPKHKVKLVASEAFSMLSMLCLFFEMVFESRSIWISNIWCAVVPALKSKGQASRKQDVKDIFSFTEKSLSKTRSPEWPSRQDVWINWYRWNLEMPRCLCFVCRGHSFQALVGGQRHWGFEVQTSEVSFVASEDESLGPGFRGTGWSEEFQEWASDHVSPWIDGRMTSDEIWKLTFELPGTLRSLRPHRFLIEPKTTFTMESSPHFLSLKRLHWISGLERWPHGLMNLNLSEVCASSFCILGKIGIMFPCHRLFYALQTSG